MYIPTEPNNLQEFVFPEISELEESDTRFDGKLGKFKLGENTLLPGNHISFLFLSQAHCFGNLGKLIKDTMFYSLFAYTLDGCFGNRLIRLFLRNDSLTNWKNAIERLFYQKVNPYECVFKAEITGKIKGEHSVFVLTISEHHNTESIRLSKQLASLMPGYEYFNALPYLNPLKHDSICLWNYKQVFDDTNKIKLIKYFEYGEQAYIECLSHEKEHNLKKLSLLRTNNGHISLAESIARKYLSATKVI